LPKPYYLRQIYTHTHIRGRTTTKHTPPVPASLVRPGPKYYY
jgi:hypothetical protein